MGMPDDKFINDAKKLGVEVLPKSDAPPKGSYVILHVEVGYPLTTELNPIEFEVKITNKRGVVSLFTDFQLKECNDQKLITFLVAHAVADSSLMSLLGDSNRLNCMTFIDLCWNSGNEAVPSREELPVFTALKENATLVDLGWHLPARIMDPLIVSMGILNELFMSGTLQEAILYGPVFHKEE